MYTKQRHTVLGSINISHEKKKRRKGEKKEGKGRRKEEGEKKGERRKNRGRRRRNYLLNA